MSGLTPLGRLFVVISLPTVGVVGYVGGWLIGLVTM